MLRTLLALLTPLLATLVGCAAGNVPTSYRFPDAPTVGIVVASVAHNAEAGPGARAVVHFDTQGNPTQNRLQSVGESISKGGPDSIDVDGGRLFVLTLPAGRHTLDAWQLRDSTTTWVQPAGALVPLAFEVKPGEVTYLGSVQATLAVRRGPMGLAVVDGGQVELRDQRERDIAVVERLYPQFKGQIVPRLLTQGAWASPAGVEVVQDTKPPTLPGARR